jgi:hypothetical protein
VSAIIVKPHRADVGRLRPDQLPFTQLLKAMCRPAEDTSDGEGRGEQLGWQSQTMQQQCGVELDVGVQSSRGFSSRPRLR